MTHDPLCPWSAPKCAFCRDTDCTCDDCSCDLIAKVRAEYKDAIAVTENAFRGAEQAWYRAGVTAGYEQGKRDMLAKCIAAVETRINVGDRFIVAEHVLYELRALQEKP